MTGDSSNRVRPSMVARRAVYRLRQRAERLPAVDADHVEADAAEQLTDNYRTHVSPVWSPDGESITFVSDLDERWNTKIYSLDLASRVITPLRVGSATDPAWSPDGRYLLYIGGIEKVGTCICGTERPSNQPCCMKAASSPTTRRIGQPTASILFTPRSSTAATPLFTSWMSAECLRQPITCTPQPLTTIPAFYRTPRWKPE